MLQLWMAKKLRPFTRTQCHKKRQLTEQVRAEEQRQARKLQRLIRRGRYVDEMTKGCAGW